MYLPYSDEKQKLDLDRWPRKEHFAFFNSFEEPYYGVTVRLDCTAAYHFAKQRGVSFFLYSVYRSLAAANEVEAFRLRIEDNDVFLYNHIDGGSAIDRPDGTFGYGFLPWSPDLNTFIETATASIARIRSTTGLTRTPANNIIRYSVLPWIDFTSLSHARAYSRADSCPYITFGKMTEHDGTRSMPISVHVNHALVDGLHLGQFLERLQQLLNTE
jgi:chloramphenicol O-acetyltransferase type A